jgi:hypothetical protein
VTGFLNQGGIAEFTTGSLAGLIRRDALRQVVLLHQLQVESELVAQVAIVPRGQRRARAEKETLEPAAHHPSCKMAAIAPAIEFQRSVSVVSSRRPLLVNR